MMWYKNIRKNTSLWGEPNSTQNPKASSNSCADMVYKIYLRCIHKLSTFMIRIIQVYYKYSEHDLHVYWIMQSHKTHNVELVFFCSSWYGFSFPQLLQVVIIWPIREPWRKQTPTELFERAFNDRFSPLHPAVLEMSKCRAQVYKLFFTYPWLPSHKQMRSGTRKKNLQKKKNQKKLVAHFFNQQQDPCLGCLLSQTSQGS